MAGLAVWAPRAARVDAVVDGVAHPMKPGERGWWGCDVEPTPSEDYGFSLDGEAPLPDPRSQRQPHGVHGLSRVVDHRGFDWQSRSWPGRELPGGVLYELHVGTFTPEGTFDAAIARLGHLVDLGVDFVEVMPVAAFPGRYGWGYDGVFPYAAHEPYGGPEGFKRFIDACHGAGLGVLLDVVYNHLGPDGNVLPRYGPYFTDKYETPWGRAINFFDAGSDDVRRYFIDNALMWLRDYRLDGLRLDAVHAIIDTSATHFIEELCADVAALGVSIGKPLAIVAESDLNDPRVISARSVGGHGATAQWSDDFHHAVHAAITGETFGYYEDFGAVADIGTAFRHGFVYAGRYSHHRRRRHGRALPPATAPSRLLAYAQTHDQVGNRARGERLAALVSPGLAKVAAALVLMSPFTPMLFMGEEWAASTPWRYFTEHGDPELAESVRTGRRDEFKSFGWKAEEVPDPQDPATARASILDWAEIDRSGHAEMLRWHRELIALRRSIPAVSMFADVRVDTDENARLLTIRRGPIAVVANLSADRRTTRAAATAVLLASTSVELDGATLTLPGESVAILRLDKVD